jgi:hypothetical protein
VTAAAGAAGPIGAAGAAGLTGAAGATTTNPTGVTISTTPSGPACWTATLPPEPQPPAPQLAVAEACSRGASTSNWTFPDDPDPFRRNNDQNGQIVGRWVSCGSNTLPVGPNDGIEFAGNGRWRLLRFDASGALVPAMPAVSGYYYVLGSGQLDLSAEGPSEGGTYITFAKFADGDHDVLGIDNEQPGSPISVYARTANSATNGDDNMPSLTDGRCSMVGSWDVPRVDGYPSEPATIWSFDGLGNFVVDSEHGVTCGAHMQYGTYRLSTADGFEITTNWNLGLCDWWFSAAYPKPQFDSTCSTLTLTSYWDNCTGGRGYLNGTTVLKRRP